MVALGILLITFLVVSGAGVLLYGALSRASGTQETLAGGAAFGFCALLLLAYAIIAAGFSYWIVAAVMLTITLVAGCWLGARGGFQLERMPRGLVLVLGLVFISRFAAASMHQFPLGWDPVFHLLLAKKILLTNTLITDWRPFRDIGLNYPIGTHNLLVFFTVVTGAPLELVFNALIPFLGVINTWQIFAMVRRVTSRDDYGIYGAFAYGMLALYGSIDYYRWGGLPNQLGMTFLLGALQLLAAAPSRYGQISMAALFLAAIPLTHHHVMISAGVIGALYVLGLIYEKRRREVRSSFVVGLCAAVLASPFLWSYLARAHTVGQTNIMAFSEDISDPMLIPDRLGYAFFALALYGFWGYKRRLVRFERQATFVGIAAGLFGLFLLLGYVVPLTTQVILGRQISPFTPSRFLTDAAYFLSLPAAFGIVLLRDKTRWSTVRLSIVLLVLALSNKDQWRELFKRVPVAPELVTAYRWIEREAPRNVVLCDQDRRWGPHGSWANYLTWHQTARTPVPISEPIPPEPALEQVIDDACRDKGQGHAHPLLAGLEIWDVVAVADIPPGVVPVMEVQHRVAIVKK